jgi:hypothetical protein
VVLQGVGLEDMYLVVAAAEACSVLCRMCSSYIVVLVKLLVGGRVVCRATDVATASCTRSCDLSRPVFFKYAVIIKVCNADFFVNGPYAIGSIALNKYWAVCFSVDDSVLLCDISFYV